MRRFQICKTSFPPSPGLRARAFFWRAFVTWMGVRFLQQCLRDDQGVTPCIVDRRTRCSRGLTPSRPACSVLTRNATRAIRKGGKLRAPDAHTRAASVRYVGRLNGTHTFTPRDHPRPVVEH